MQRTLGVLLCCAVLAACVTTRRGVPAPGAGVPWEQRVPYLQGLEAWTLDGRAAVAVGTQGWQATLNWRQRGDSAEVHLSGPLGVGSMVLKRTPAGVSLNDAPPGAAVLAQLQERLGFDPPLDHLRFWLLGVPDPKGAFEITRNAQDRAAQLKQDGWTIEYDGYMAAAGDLLPAHLVVTREGVRVRVAVDRWGRP